MNKLGILSTKQGNYKKAEEYLLEAVKEGEIKALNSLGILYYQQKRYEESERKYKEAIEKGVEGAKDNLEKLHKILKK